MVDGLLFSACVRSWVYHLQQREWSREGKGGRRRRGKKRRGKRKGKKENDEKTKTEKFKIENSSFQTL